MVILQTAVLSICLWPPLRQDKYGDTQAVDSKTGLQLIHIW